ncbi:hypothetical protein [Williamsia sp. M5A3_1d]
MGVFLVLASFVGVSFGRAMLAPGYASPADKTSAWLRDHGAGSIVDHIENWYYTRHSPSTTPADSAQLATGVAASAAAIPLTSLPVPAGAGGAPRWRATCTSSDGTPVVYTSAFEPDRAHPSIVTGVAVINSRATATHLMTGTTQPRSAMNTSAAQVPATDRSLLVAVFNSGFRFGDITGGVYDFGHAMIPLRSGQATAAIDDRGHLTVGAWGRDITMTRHLVAARQNLDLVVDNGHPLPATGSSGAQWGGTHLQFQYTWRSGLGVDRNHNVVYVAGDHLNLTTLASALAQAGAVRGMQLDMHTGMSTFISWHTTDVGSREPSKLMPSMPGPETRYLIPDRRDFFYVTDTSPVSVPVSTRGR